MIFSAALDICAVCGKIKKISDLTGNGGGELTSAVAAFVFFGQFTAFVYKIYIISIKCAV